MFGDQYLNWMLNAKTQSLSCVALTLNPNPSPLGLSSLLQFFHCLILSFLVKLNSSLSILPFLVKFDSSLSLSSPIQLLSFPLVSYFHYFLGGRKIFPSHFLLPLVFRQEEDFARLLSLGFPCYWTHALSMFLSQVLWNSCPTLGFLRL